MFTKSQPGRAAARKWQTLHLQKRNNVLIETGPVFELFDEIEKNVGRTGLQFLPHEIDIVVDGEMLRSVTELAQRGHDVRLGFPVLCFQLFCEVLIEFGGTCAVEQHEDFEFLFHAKFFLLSF